MPSSTRSAACCRSPGNKSEAARLLRTDYKTLHLKMKQYGIPAAEFRDVVTRA